ncbi:MAG: hypothetical protein E7Z87_00095 [Cyanobacteria bacterium SIG26]|nr:hypothetical protein [Cyanobacteria bacterium SIG26]
MNIAQTFTKTITLPTNGVFRCMTCTIPQKGSETYYSDAKDVLKTIDNVLQTSEKTINEFGSKKDPLSTLFAVIGTGRLLEAKNPKLLELKKLYFNNDSAYNNESAIKKAINAVGEKLDLMIDVTVQ